MNYASTRSTSVATPSSRFSLLLLLFLVTVGLRAADPYSKEIDRSFAAVPEVAYAQKNGFLEILPATDNKIRFVALISIEAGDEESAQQFFRNMELLTTESSTSLDLRLNLNNVTSWTTTNRRSLIKFGNGEKIRGVRNFEVRSTLYLPPTEVLALALRFGDVELGAAVSLNDLSLVLSNTDLRGGAVGGELEVDARFGSVVLESVVGRISGKLSNGRLEIEQGGSELDLNTRFSELLLGPMQSVDLTSSNDKVEISAVTGRLRLNERFGRYRLGTTGRADIVSSNGDYTVEKGGEYTVNGRFTTMEFEEVATLVLDGNSNCTYRIDRLEEVRGDGRFTNLKVDRLTDGAELDLTNGELNVDLVGPEFSGIQVDGRFFELNIRRVEAERYQARAKLSSGRFEVPEELTARIDKENGSKLEKHFLTEGATEASPTIEANGTNGSLRIR